MKIRELGTNLYQFVFTSQSDKDRIQKGKASTFDSQFLILKPWSEKLNFQMEVFNRIHIWIQVWNLPNHWMSKETGFRFNHVFCDVIDVIIPEYGSKKGRHMKILVELDL